ncbi:MAG: hypothetical protein FJX76_07335 [Armatimonadetes bacterium]|nr:hypothetical protein [Armatimonadota bacterium]
MHMSIRQYKTQQADEVTRRVNEEFVPLISTAPEFIAYYATSPGDGTWVSVSIFQSKESAENSNHLAADYVAEHVAALMDGPPRVLAGQVIAHHKAAG